VRQALCRTHQEKAVAQLFSGENAMVSHYRQDLAAAVPPPCLDLDHGVAQQRGERDACSIACGHPLTLVPLHAAP